MIFFLHIGMPKTGTTTIQNFLASNRSQLLKQNFFYPKSVGNNSPLQDNHLKLAAYAMNPDKIDDLKTNLRLYSSEQVYEFRKKLTADFTKEMAGLNANKVVLSNEHCSTRLLQKQEIEELKAFLSPFYDDIRIIVYLRRQDNSFLSAYSSAIKSGQHEPLMLPDEQERILRYDYWELLQRWSEVFGQDKVSVKVFEREQLLEGDLIKDFCQEIQLDVDDGFSILSDANFSLDHECCEFLRLFNQYVPRFIEEENNWRRDNIVTLLEQYSGSSRIGVGGELMDEFMNSFSDSNRKVAELYLDRPDGKLFLKEFSTRNRVEHESEPLNMDKAFEIFAYLWNQKLDEIKRKENMPLSEKIIESLRSLKRKSRSRNS